MLILRHYCDVQMPVLISRNIVRGFASMITFTPQSSIFNFQSSIRNPQLSILTPQPTKPQPAQLPLCPRKPHTHDIPAGRDGAAFRRSDFNVEQSLKFQFRLFHWVAWAGWVSWFGIYTQPRAFLQGRKVAV